MKPTNTARRFNTFGGVFTPCVLTILGVIMFMRSGYVLGNTGLWGALIIVALANVITLLTALSLSAISTNLEVGGGGVYFMISRVLGPSYGGAIGISLFFAQTVSVALYIIGFTEALTTSFPLLLAYKTIIASGTCIALYIITMVGADWSIRIQYFVLGILLVAVASFMIGGIIHFDPAILNQNLKLNPSTPIGFWIAFAIFFPAVTGITAGANMSGDLKEPGKAIPLGTLAAIGITFLIYLAQMFVMAGSISQENLIYQGFELLKSNSLVPLFVIAGVFAATLSSAMGSFLGAPRIMQALARDHIFTLFDPLGKGNGSNQEPRRAITLTFIIAMVFIVFVELDVVAKIITMFFMITYGMMNFSTYYEGFSRNPSFRPTFRFFHWTSALLGTLFCFGVMLLISLKYAILALVIFAIIYKYVRKKATENRWGSSERGYLFEKTRRALLKLEETSFHAKNWRPHIVVFSTNPRTRFNMVNFADWLECKHGILTLAQLIPGELSKMLPKKEAALKELKEFIKEYKLDAFAEVDIVSEDFLSGLATFLQSYSIGGLKPNTVLFGLPEDSKKSIRFMEILNICQELKKNILILYTPTVQIDIKKRNKRIDIWWGGTKNGSLMAIFAYLLSQNQEWTNAEIRFLRIVSEEKNKQEAQALFDKIIKRSRIDAKAQVFTGADTPWDVILRESANSDLILMGMQIPETGQAEQYLSETAKFVEQLPTTLFVNSTGEADIFA
ncbi:MAG: amino acid permease [Pseudomonadota bacterium]